MTHPSQSSSLHKLPLKRTASEILAKRKKMVRVCPSVSTAPKKSTSRRGHSPHRHRCH
jgi:hypothetical protein